jgi:hypothetical protein
MKQIFKIASASTLSIVLTLSLTACGGGDTSKDSSNSSQDFTSPKKGKDVLVKIVGDSSGPEAGTKVADFVDGKNRQRAKGFISDSGKVYEPIHKDLEFNSVLSEAVNAWLGKIYHDKYGNWIDDGNTSNGILVTMNPFKVEGYDGKRRNTSSSMQWDETLMEYNLKLGSGFSSCITFGDDSNVSSWYDGNLTEKNKYVFSAGKDAVCGVSDVVQLTDSKIYDGVVEDKAVIMICGYFSQK